MRRSRRSPKARSRTTSKTFERPTARSCGGSSAPSRSWTRLEIPWVARRQSGRFGTSPAIFRRRGKNATSVFGAIGGAKLRSNLTRVSTRSASAPPLPTMHELGSRLAPAIPRPLAPRSRRRDPKRLPSLGQNPERPSRTHQRRRPSPGQAIAPERIRALDESAPPPPDLRTFNPAKKGPRVTLDATKHILATEIEATHNVPLSTLGRWVNYGRLPTLGRIGKTRVFDRSAFLICKNDWNPRGGNNMRIDAHQCEGA